MQDWIAGTITENSRWTDQLFSLKIAADIASYQAGQFTSLALDLDGTRVARPYSHLSPPGQQPLEYFLYTATGGTLSNALVTLQAGDSIWVRKQSNGFFILQELPPARDLWMLATGTGVAPFFSILGSAEVWQRFATVVLVYGVRTAADLRYRQRIRDLLARHGQQLRFQPFVSREQVPDTLPGRIPAAIASGALPAAVGLGMDPAHSHFMLCGNPAMVQDVTNLLKTRGFRKHRRRTAGHITTENYW